MQATMRAIRITGYGGPDKLSLDQVPLPEPGPGQLLVRVHGASVNPVDWKLRVRTGGAGGKVVLSLA